MRNCQPNLKIATNRGFSLIEVLVSLAVFAVVVTISVGTLVVLINANAKVQNMQTAMTNLTFALDSITREIRTGTIYHCRTSLSDSLSGTSDPQDCFNGGVQFEFNEAGRSLTGSDGPRMGYRFNDGRLERKLGQTGDWQALTAPDIEITEGYFAVSGTTRGDIEPPIVTIYLAGTVVGAATEGTEAEFEMQTTVTQYVQDI